MMTKIHLQVKTSAANSDEILSWFNQLNQPPLSDMTIWWQCQTVLLEGFANVVDHAHKNLPPETPIDLEAVRFSNYIEIRIWDYGMPFDFEEKLQEVSALDDEDNERGRGLIIIAEVADELRYERTDDARNCLVIVKNY